MSDAFKKPPGSHDLSPYAPKRVREAARSARLASPTRFEILRRSAPPKRASVSALEDAAEGERFTLPDFLEKRSGSAPSPERDPRADARRLRRAGVAVAILGGLAIVAFASPAGLFGGGAETGRSAQRRVFDENFDETQSGAGFGARLALTPSAPYPPGADAPLGVSVRDPRHGGLIVVTGLPPGATLSAGGPADEKSWWLSFADLPNLMIVPPPKFVGAMDLVVELRLADTTVSDRRRARVEWADRAAAQPKSGGAPHELAATLEHARELIARGDIETARQLVRRALNTSAPTAGAPPFFASGRPMLSPGWDAPRELPAVERGTPDWTAATSLPAAAGQDISNLFERGFGGAQGAARPRRKAW